MSRYLTFIKRPVYAVLLIFLLLAGGFYALQKLSVSLLPGLNYPLLNLVTQYPGTSPENMELLVTRPIELEMQGIRGIRRTYSISTMGISQVTVEFSSGFDQLSARQLVSAALSRISANLPPNVHPVIDNLGSRLDQIIGYTFTNLQIPQTKLRQLVEYQLAPALHTIHGISRIQVLGGQKESFTVEPNLQKLMQFNLSVADIQAILQTSNLNVSGYYLTGFYHDIPILGKGQIEKIEDVENLYVKDGGNGIPVLLKDVATVRLDYLPEHYSISSDQTPAVALIIQKQPNFSTIQVAREVNSKIMALRKLLPEGTEYHKFYDQSEVINESIGGIEIEIIIGAILAILVLHYFLRRWKSTWIVAITIPLSLFFALIAMYFSGFSLNMMTLAALTLAVGMVVDDSIIIMENIERMEESGLSLDTAVIDGIGEIAGPDISGTVTTIAVFLPLLFLTGFVGQIVIPFGATISYTLLGSLGLSLAVVPILMHWKGPSRRKAKEPRTLQRFQAFNDRILNFAVSHKVIIFISIFILLVASVIGLGLKNPINFIPQVDEGAILIEYHLPPGTSLAESKKIARICSQIIRSNPDVSTVYLKIGSPENTYFVEDVNVGEFMIKLKPRSQRSQNINTLMEKFRRQLNPIPGVTFFYHLPTQEKIDESFSGLPAFFGVTITGPSLDSLISISTRVEKAASATPGLSNIVNNAHFQVPQILVVPRREQLAAYHLTVNQVMQQMQAAFRGEVISYFIKNQIPIALFLRLDRQQRYNIEALQNYPILTGPGKVVLLKQLCSISYQNISPTITHLNGQREVTLTSDISGNIFGVVKILRDRISRLKLPAGYFVEIRGEYQSLIQSLVSFFWVIGFAIVLVYIVLYLQFHSFWQPFVILFKIPMDFTGAFIALLITRQSLNISVGIAFLTLIGISVNNAIVLLDFTNRNRKKGMKRLAAIRNAVHIRTRPILMTGLTTIFALIPAAIGGGVGSKFYQPFAIALIGGLVFGVMFSLNVIPALYDGFAGFFERRGV
jgi:CzcA family heavy metal efflux pump